MPGNRKAILGIYPQMRVRNAIIFSKATVDRTSSASSYCSLAAPLGVMFGEAKFNNSTEFLRFPSDSFEQIVQYSGRLQDKDSVRGHAGMRHSICSSYFVASLAMCTHMYSSFNRYLCTDVCVTAQSRHL
jgi:hypothetical protein